MNRGEEKPWRPGEKPAGVKPSSHKNETLDTRAGFNVGLSQKIRAQEAR